MFPLAGSILNPVPVPIDNKRSGAGGPIEDMTYWLEDDDNVLLVDDDGVQLVDSEG